MELRLKTAESKWCVTQDQKRAALKITVEHLSSVEMKFLPFFYEYIDDITCNKKMMREHKCILLKYCVSRDIPLKDDLSNKLLFNSADIIYNGKYITDKVNYNLKSIKD